MVMQVRRTPTANNPPPAGSLAEGQLSVGMADTPPRLWCGVPTSINAAGFVLLNPRPPQTTTSVTAPANPVAGDLWFDLSQNPAALMVWNGSTWLPATPADAEDAYLPLSGGTLTGPLAIDWFTPTVNAPLYVAGANIAGASIVANGTIQGGALWSQGDSSCVGAFNGGSMALSGSATCFNLSAAGTVQAAAIWSTGTLTAQGAFTGTTIALSGNMTCAGITASATIQAPTLTSTGGVNANTTNGTFTGANLNLSGSGTCVNLTATGQVTGLYIQANNSGWQPGGGLWNDSSDARIKAIESDYSTGLAAIEALKPIVYRFKGNELNERGQCFHRQVANEGKRFVGLTGQNIEMVMPESVWREKGTIDGEAAEILTTNQGSLVYALINAVKELSARVRELEGARP